MPFEARGLLFRSEDDLNEYLEEYYGSWTDDVEWVEGQICSEDVEELTEEEFELQVKLGVTVYTDDMEVEGYTP